jgi:hypothetical protein
MLGFIIIANLIHLFEIVCIQILFLYKSYYNVNNTINNTISHVNYSYVDIYNSSNFYT